MTKITIKQDAFKDICKYCDKVIIGSTEEQVAYNMLIHKLNKHPDKMIITESNGKS